MRAPVRSLPGSVETGTHMDQDSLTGSERGEPPTRATVTRCHWCCARPSARRGHRRLGDIEQDRAILVQRGLTQLRRPRLLVLLLRILVHRAVELRSLRLDRRRCRPTLRIHAWAD